MRVTNVGEMEIAGGVTLTRMGAVIAKNMTSDEFCHGLQNCQKLANASMWAIGDLLVYGEGRGDWGEMYTQAIDLTQKSYTSLTQAAMLSKAYPIEDRVEDVSWSHHREALPLREPGARKEILELAASTGMSRDDVREHVKTGAEPTTSNKPRKYTCPQCGHQWSSQPKVQKVKELAV